MFKIWLCLMFTTLSAENLGTFGKTYPVSEENLLTFIKNNAGRISQNAIQDLAKQAALAHRKGLCKETSKNSVHYFDPTVTAKKDIKDHKGNVVVKKGTTFNPLTIHSLDTPLLFFSGDILSHVDWAKNQTEDSYWILTSGKPLELEGQEKRPVYFDQAGELIRKLKIKTVPALVTQEGSRIRVEHILLQGGL